MKQEVVIDIVSGIQGGQRQPGEGWGTKVFCFDVFPKQARPLHVVIAVEITAANRSGRKLKSPEQNSNGQCAYAEFGGAHRGLAFHPSSEAICARRISDSWRGFLEIFHCERECRNKKNKSTEKCRGWRS